MVACVGILASLVGAAATELGKCIAEPIKRRFNYLCCFHANIQNLRDEMPKLDGVRDRLKERVTAKENNAEMINREVKNWLKDANDKIKIGSNVVSEQSGSLSMKSRYSLSKKAKKTAEAMKQLRESCNFDPISHPRPPASMAPIPLGTTYDQFESRKHIEEDIIATLRGNKVNVLGICGMGGVGKTTMAKVVMNRAKEECIIDETVMAVVSQQVEMSKIQDHIAEQLGLKLEGENLLSRAQRLCDRLGQKKILIVADDIWESLKLDDLGIPCESGSVGCKVLLTSRNKKIFNQMKVQPEYQFQLDVLKETEAWDLFKSSTGSCSNDQEVLRVAEEVVKECNGLPLALVTIGLALNDQKDINIWRATLQQVKDSNPECLPEVLRDVYQPLRVSYELLENEAAKSLFLLCCLFAEDANIPISYLTFYVVGLRMLGGIRDLQQARNSTCLLVDMLKSRFLLLEGRGEYHVRMHDVVRDVAIFIASEKGLINYNDCSWISPYLRKRNKGLISENLRLLWTDNSGDDELEITDNSFSGMTELNVLFVKHNPLKSSPNTTESLQSLRTLILDSCRSLEGIDIVGKLVNLEILICRDCDSIEELPKEIGGLIHLKMLEILNCWELKTVAPGVISSLVGLEELKINVFDKWEAEVGGEKKNAALNEIQTLSSLTCLEIEVADSSLAAEQILLSPRIVKFDITIGGRGKFIFKNYLKSEKKIKLALPREISLGGWIRKFLGSVQDLELWGDGLSNLELGEALQNVRSFFLMACRKVEKLVNVTISSIDECGKFAMVFPLLEYLNLSYLFILVEICDVGQSRSPIHIKFSKLKVLRLDHLPNLTTFDKGIESIELPLLTRLEIYYCPNVKSLVSTTTTGMSGNNHNYLGGISHEHDDDSIHLFCNPEKVAFESLEELKIYGYENTSILWCHQIPIDFFRHLGHLNIMNCGNLRSLFSSSITTNLDNLKQLRIASCKELVTVIEDDEKKDACQSGISLFPSLKTLILDSLYKLEMFCKWRCALELPSLNHVYICCCPKMEQFCLGSITHTPIRATLEFIGVIGDCKDLNNAVQQNFLRSKEGEEIRKKRPEEEEKKKEEEEREEEQQRKGEIEGEQN